MRPVVAIRAASCLVASLAVVLAGASVRAETLEDAWAQMAPNSPNRDSRAGALLAVRAPLVGAAAGPNDKAKAARIERQELAVFGLMLERAGGA